MGLKTSGRYLDMIRKERNNEKGRQPLPADCGGWDSYREAVSYTIWISLSVGRKNVQAVTSTSLLGIDFDVIF